MASTKRFTQKDIILQHLKDYGSISSWEAIKEYGATRLSAIIFILKKDGCMFDEEWITTTNRYNQPTTYKKYILRGVANA